MLELPVLWIITPCYNEQEVIKETSCLFKQKLKQLILENTIDKNSKILYVNDGSTDRTWEIICELTESSTEIIGISLSRNRGHQNALLAGLMEAKDYCDITITIDCDGQDDLDAIDKMLKAYQNGYEIVYGVRAERDRDTWVKRTTAQAYYHLLQLLGTEIVYNHADYRLVSTKVLLEFSEYDEVNIFLRGMFPLVGFKSTSVYYNRAERIAGRSHYSIGKMLNLAIDGVTSLTIRPIRVISTLGFLICILGAIGIVWAVIEALIGNTVAGWASLICVIFLLGGIQLLSIGIIGEYVGKTYMESKHRPRYIISERSGQFENPV